MDAQDHTPDHKSETPLVEQSVREGQPIETDIPARLDRLRWGRFHTLVLAALGITWILDGLEVTLAGSVAVAPAIERGLSAAISR